jgi:hypothetical protein
LLQAGKTDAATGAAGRRDRDPPGARSRASRGRRASTWEMMERASTAEDVFIGLRLRNVKLNRSATIKEQHSLESKLQITLHPFFSNLLSKFNGFISSDQKSQICLWGTDDWISHSDLMIEVNGESKFAIGDTLIYSDFIMCSLENDSTPVFLLDEGRRMASNIREFFDQLIRGEFDFM